MCLKDGYQLVGESFLVRTVHRNDHRIALGQTEGDDAHDRIDLYLHIIVFQLYLPAVAFDRLHDDPRRAQVNTGAVLDRSLSRYHGSPTIIAL